jgi:hypothetical protein
MQASNSRENTTDSVQRTKYSIKWLNISLTVLKDTILLPDIFKSQYSFSYFYSVGKYLYINLLNRNNGIVTIILLPDIPSNNCTACVDRPTFM